MATQHDLEAEPALGDLVRAGLSCLSDLFAKILNGINGIAPIALVLGCQGPRVDKKAPSPKAETSIPAPKKKHSEHDEPKPLGRFDITFYYVASEDDDGKAQAGAANDNADLVAVAPVETAPDAVSIYEPKHCTKLADISHAFLQQLVLQGTGKLRDGRVVNVWGACSCPGKCFKPVAGQWGTGGAGRPLQPFRTVAVDRNLIKLGSLLYVPDLEGRTMPGRKPLGGFVHDGCVMADDTGGGIIGNQLDLFVGRKAYFYGLASRGGSHAWARNTPVFDGTGICERKGRKISKRAASI